VSPFGALELGEILRGKLMGTKSKENKPTKSVEELIRQLQALPKGSRFNEKYCVSIYNTGPTAKELGLKKQIYIDQD
jgi:hypothetical protein